MPKRPVKWFVGIVPTVAYKIPTILTILATVFMDAWRLSSPVGRPPGAGALLRARGTFFSAVSLRGRYHVFRRCSSGCSRRRLL